MAFSNALERAAFAAFATASSPSHFGYYPGEACRKMFPNDAAAQAVLRSVVNPLETGDVLALVHASVLDFLGSLAPESAAARLMQRGMAINLFAGHDSVSIPYRTGRASLGWVGEGNPIPVLSKIVGAAKIGPLRKFAGISTFSSELARAASAQEIFGRMMREDAANALDDAVFSASAETADSPAGLLHGVTSIPAATGGGLAAMETDLATLATAVTNGGGSSVVYVLSPQLAALAEIRKPELRERFWIAPGLPAGRAIALDPRAFAFAAGGVDVEASKDAVVHSDTAPGGISTAGTPNAVSAPVQSMFQHDLVALRLIFDVSFTMRAPGLVAFMNGAAW